MTSNELLHAAVGADCRCFINPVTGEPYPLWAGDHYQGDIDHDPDCSATSAHRRSPAVSDKDCPVCGFKGDRARGDIIFTLQGEINYLRAERDALLPAIRCLFAVYEAWWHKVGTSDPGDELARAGYAALLTSDDDQLMETVCLAVERYEALIHLALQRTEGAQP